MSTPAPRALYLEVEGAAPIFAVLHMPSESARSDVAVLICPPFGWEDICSYRSRRAWAENLAQAGHPTLRIDLPGSGDSGGSPEDAGLLSAWVQAVGSATDWLSRTGGCSRVAGIGIGLGGLLLCCAAADGAPLTEMVLWGVPARGRAFVRELGAFGRLESTKFAPHGGPNPPELPDGYTGAGGYVLSAETTASLSALDLSALALGPPHPGRVLLLGRDGIAADSALHDHLLSSGAHVSVAAGEGYGAMMAEPQEARPPLGVFADVRRWLSERPPAPASAEASGPPGEHPAPVGRSAPPAVEREHAELTIDGVRIRERPIRIEQPFGSIFGILSEPESNPPGELGAILLNAGAIRRVGPNRMWVELARRWAARGVPTMRLDLEGFGDADGDSSRFTDVSELYVPELVAQVEAALGCMAAATAADRFALVGLCSGAYWSFHGALRDERVVAAFMLNPRTLFWDASQETVRYLRRGLLKPDSWRMVLSGEVPLPKVAGVVRRAPASVLRRMSEARGSRGEPDELELALERLLDDGKQLVFMFSEGEPLHEELERHGRLAAVNVPVELIPGRDHTLRPLYAQEAAHRALDMALSQQLAARAPV